MPTVPYPDQPRVQPSGLPSVRVSGNAPLEAFGGGAALPSNAAAPLSEMARIAQEATDHANQVAFTGAAAALTDAKTALLYHPQSGLLNQRGENALSAPEQARAGWDAAVEQIQAGLTTPQQKAAFHKYALTDWSQVNLDVQRHVAQQRVVVDTEKTNGLNAALTQEAVNVAAKGVLSPDPTVRFQALAKATANAQQVADNTRAYATRQGLPKEAITEQVAKTVSGFHAQVLGAMATDPDANWVEFTDYYERHKEQLVGDQREQMARLVANNASIGAAQQGVDAILDGQPIPPHAQYEVTVDAAGTDIAIESWEPSQGPPPSVSRETPQGVPQGVPGKIPTLTDARAAVANSNASPKQKKLMLQMIDQEFAKRDAAKRDQAQAVSSQFTAALDHGVPLATVMKRPEFDALPTETKSNIKAYAKQVAGGNGTETNVKTWYDLFQMSNADLARTDISKYIGSLSADDFKKLAERQQSARAGISTPETAEHQTATATIKSALDALWPRPSDRETKTAAPQVQAFTRAAQDAIDDARLMNGGKPLSRQQMQDAVDAVTTKVRLVKPGHIWDTTEDVPVFNLPTRMQEMGADSVVINQPMTPSQRLRAIQQARLTTRNAFPSEDAIKQAHETLMRDQIRRTQQAGRP